MPATSGAHHSTRPVVRSSFASRDPRGHIDEVVAQPRGRKRHEHEQPVHVGTVHRCPSGQVGNVSAETFFEGAYRRGVALHDPARLEAALGSLVTLPLWKSHRALDLQGFHFGEKRVVMTRKGQQAESASTLCTFSARGACEAHTQTDSDSTCSRMTRWRARAVSTGACSVPPSSDRTSW
jgi:hypothetical protein